MEKIDKLSKLIKFVILVVNTKTIVYNFVL